MNTRQFALGLALGAPLGACVFWGVRFVSRWLRERSERARVEEGPFVDGTGDFDPLVDWTIECESRCVTHDLASEIPDFTAESQRW